jgi:hypothetical protein
MTATLNKRRGPPPQEERLGEETKSQGVANSPLSRKLAGWGAAWGAAGFVLGGMGWIAVYLVSVRFASAPPTSVVPLDLSIGLYMGTIVLSVVGLIGLHALQRGSYGGIGRAGFYTILASSVATVVAGVGYLLGSPVLGWLANPVGTLGIVVGFSLYGAATVQAKVMPRWYGVALIIFLPVTVLLGPYAKLAVGVVQLVLGAVLWRRRAALTEKRLSEAQPENYRGYRERAFHAVG